MIEKFVFSFLGCLLGIALRRIYDIGIEIKKIKGGYNERNVYENVRLFIPKERIVNQNSSLFVSPLSIVVLEELKSLGYDVNIPNFTSFNWQKCFKKISIAYTINGIYIVDVEMKKI